jgi:hypothetical protein
MPNYRGVAAEKPSISTLKKPERARFARVLHEIRLQMFRK